MDTTRITTYLPSLKTDISGNVVVGHIEADQLVATAGELYHTHKLPLKTIAALDDTKEGGTYRILYVFGVPGEAYFIALSLKTNGSFPSLTPTIHEANLYERKIRSFFGLEPVGHPNPRSIILHENWPEGVYPLRKNFAWNEKVKKGHTPFAFTYIGGEEGIYELPVGPVHAGIIEPGHFRFHLAGEEILNLEPRLGYSHKGTEKLFETLPMDKKVKLSERIAGDSSCNYSLAFCQAIETLANITVPARGKHLRVVYAELERLANHFSDIGAIMTDTGFNFGGAQGARLRERVMRICEKLTGSRFLRGVNTIGGVTRDLSKESVAALREEVRALHTDFAEVMGVAAESSSLLNRLRDTGILDPQVARDHGCTGVAGRAVGIATDARTQYPYAAYSALTLDMSLAEAGDVEARFSVRVQEVYTSISLILQALDALPNDSIAKIQPVSLAPNTLAVSVVEGWRGDVVFVVATDAKGDITRVEVRDPSLLNWPCVGLAGKGNMVPDFPLINKSFSLSYTGGDL